MNRLYSKDSSISFPYIQSFAEDSEGKIWVNSADGWYGYIDSNTPLLGIRKKYNLKNHGITESLIQLASDKDGNVRGTKITAARDGVVTRVKEDGILGGWSRKYRSHGNNIIIQHPHGSRAGYWHLQHNGALVNVGDTVRKGQVIALSGKTGYAAIPHLHFLVWTFDNNRQWRQVATRFETSKGIRYLRSWKKYRKARNK